MPEYEIRIFDADNDQPELTLEQFYRDDGAAIGAAFQLANGAPFDV